MSDDSVNNKPPQSGNANALGWGFLRAASKEVHGIPSSKQSSFKDSERNPYYKNMFVEDHLGNAAAKKGKALETWRRLMAVSGPDATNAAGETHEEFQFLQQQKDQIQAMINALDLLLADPMGLEIKDADAFSQKAEAFVRTLLEGKFGEAPNEKDLIDGEKDKEDFKKLIRLLFNLDKNYPLDDLDSVDFSDFCQFSGEGTYEQLVAIRDFFSEVIKFIDMPKEVRAHMIGPISQKLIAAIGEEPIEAPKLEEVSDASIPSPDLKLTHDAYQDLKRDIKKAFLGGKDIDPASPEFKEYDAMIKKIDALIPDDFAAGKEITLSPSDLGFFFDKRLALEKENQLFEIAQLILPQGSTSVSLSKESFRGAWNNLVDLIHSDLLTAYSSETDDGNKEELGNLFSKVTSWYWHGEEAFSFDPSQLDSRFQVALGENYTPYELLTVLDGMKFSNEDKTALDNVTEKISDPGKQDINASFDPLLPPDNDAKIYLKVNLPEEGTSFPKKELLDILLKARLLMGSDSEKESNSILQKLIVTLSNAMNRSDPLPEDFQANLTTLREWVAKVPNPPSTIEETQQMMGKESVDLLVKFLSEKRPIVKVHIAAILNTYEQRIESVPLNEDSEEKKEQAIEGIQEERRKFIDHLFKVISSRDASDIRGDDAETYEAKTLEHFDALWETYQQTEADDLTARSLSTSQIMQIKVDADKEIEAFTKWLGVHREGIEKALPEATADPDNPVDPAADESNPSDPDESDKPKPTGSLARDYTSSSNSSGLSTLSSEGQQFLGNRFLGAPTEKKLSDHPMVTLKEDGYLYVGNNRIVAAEGSNMDENYIYVVAENMDDGDSKGLARLFVLDRRNPGKGTYFEISREKNSNHDEDTEEGKKQPKFNLFANIGKLSIEDGEVALGSPTVVNHPLEHAFTLQMPGGSVVSIYPKSQVKNAEFMVSQGDNSIITAPIDQAGKPGPFTDVKEDRARVLEDSLIEIDQNNASSYYYNPKANELFPGLVKGNRGPYREVGTVPDRDFTKIHDQRIRRLVSEGQEARYFLSELYKGKTKEEVLSYLQDNPKEVDALEIHMRNLARIPENVRPKFSGTPHNQADIDKARVLLQKMGKGDLSERLAAVKGGDEAAKESLLEDLGNIEAMNALFQSVFDEEMRRLMRKATGQHIDLEQLIAAWMGGDISFEELLMAVLAVLLKGQDEEIAKTIQDLHNVSNDMKFMPSDALNKSPGFLESKRTENTVLQLRLQHMVGQRQRLIDTISNAQKSDADAKHNSIRRMV